MTPEQQDYYQRGYRAGRKRTKRDIARELTVKHEHEVWQRYMASALAICITVDGWKHGDTPIRTIEQRMHLAGSFADAVLQETIRRGRL